MAVTRNINIFAHRAGGFLLLFALFFGLAGQALAASPENLALGQPQLIEREGKLWLNLPISVTNENALGDMLRDGASLELLIEVIIERKRTLWFNETVKEARFASIIRHDPLNREFRLTMPPSGEVKQDTLLRGLLAKSWKELKVPLTDLDIFKPSEDYLIEISISLKHTELPSWLERTLVFWGRDVVSSEQLSLDYKVQDATVSR